MNEQTKPPTLKECFICGGECVMVQVTPLHTGTSLIATQSERSTGLFSGRSSWSYLDALACTRCGYTTFFARQPENLKPYEH